MEPALTDIQRNRAMETDKGYDDPLAVSVGLGVGAEDLPCRGWPKTFKKDVVVRILGFLPADD